MGRIPPDSPAASAGQLAALLLEEALRHIRAGAAGLERGRVDEARGALRRAAQIIIELHASLDSDATPDLAAALTGIYRFVCYRLNDAALLHDARPAREAERAFEPLADAFAAAAARLAPEEER